MASTAIGSTVPPPPIVGLPAVWLVANPRNGVSSLELARAREITQKQGWVMLHRIRLAMQTRKIQQAHGEVEVEVEVDEA